jgi:hypothetical protein
MSEHVRYVTIVARGEKRGKICVEAPNVITNSLTQHAACGVRRPDGGTLARMAGLGALPE